MFENEEIKTIVISISTVILPLYSKITFYFYFFFEKSQLEHQTNHAALVVL